jgi:hypothetical protein
LRLCTTTANKRWPVCLKDGAAQQEAVKESDVRATQQEAPEEPGVEDEADDKP